MYNQIFSLFFPAVEREGSFKTIDKRLRTFKFIDTKLGRQFWMLAAVNISQLGNISSNTLSV